MSLNKEICIKCVRNMLKEEFGEYMLVHAPEFYVGESFVSCPAVDWKAKSWLSNPPENCFMMLEQLLKTEENNGI